MIKRIVIILALINVFISLKAAQVPENLAKIVAENFLKKQINNDPNLKGKTFNLNVAEVVKMKSSSSTAFFIFNISNSGFIIISGDDKVYPILGYSFTNALNMNDLPPALSQWLDNYNEQISFEAGKNITRNEITEVWEAYKKNDVTAKSGKVSQIQPLLLTTWNQDLFYNAYCPADAAGSGGHVYAGCVATAMGQIMKYYNYPQQGIGSYSYEDWTYGYQFADFENTTYNWTGMPNNVTSHNNAVAELLYHCGVSVDHGHLCPGAVCVPE